MMIDVRKHMTYTDALLNLNLKLKKKEKNKFTTTEVIANDFIFEQL